MRVLESSLSEHEQTNRSCVPNQGRNSSRLRFTVNTPKESELRSRPEDFAGLRRLSSESTDSDECGRHFLFDKRWRNGIHHENHFREEALRNLVLPPLSQDYPVHLSHNLNRFSHRRQQPNRITQLCTFGSCGGFDLPSVSSVLLTVTTPPVGRRRSVVYAESFKDRLKTNVRVRNLLPPAFNSTAKPYPDPVLGAQPLFIQRLSEISTLEVETVRQEKVKNLKKNKRQES